MKGILRLLLSDFKYYRKKKGGTWYLITFPHPNSVAIWTQVPPHPYYNKMILKIEKYD
jgi:hypothetical protein